MPTVLIVDDALTDRVRVSGIASKWLDCTILQADNGRTALEQIATHLPDLVLTDLHMPEMDGLELVSAVKDDYPSVPIILMTAQGSEEIAAQALRRGAASYVPKLRLADDLIATLQQVYSAAQSEQSQSHLMHYMTDTVTSFVLPNDPALLRACVRQLMNMLRCLPLGDETERLRVGIALQEALNNAYYHGNLEVASVAGSEQSRLDEVALMRCDEDPYVHRRIHVRAEISRTQAIFVVRDDGSGFDATAIGGLESSRADNGRQGRGITLIKSTMDEVVFNDVGNEIRMVRYAIGNDADDDEDDGDYDDPSH